MKASEVVPRPIINCKLNRILDILGCCLAVQSDFLDYSQNIIEATEALTLEIVFLFQMQNLNHKWRETKVVGDSDPTKLFVKTVASSTQSMECCSSTMMGVAHNCRSEKIDAYMLC